jgi:thioredoxin reductase (NADPH)
VNETSFDVAVVGAGIAGLTAAQHAALSGCSVAVFSDTELLGGLVANVGVLDGFPSVGEVSGTGLAQQFLRVNSALGVALVNASVTGIKKNGDRAVLTSGAIEWTAQQVILASGARLKPLDVPGAERFVDRGVLQCAWCNAGLFRGSDVVVIGGGDSALQEALHLAAYAASVTIVTRGEQLRARRSYVGRASDTENISFRWNSEIVAVLGDANLKGVRIADRTSGARDEIDCAGVFVYTGLVANSGWLADLVERDERGFVRTSPSLETRTRGLYAVGAVRSGFSGLLTSAVGEATDAALRAAATVAGAASQ